MALRFTANDCTQAKINNAKDTYGRAYYQCQEGPYGSECTVSSIGQYPATLDGCRSCTSECGKKVPSGDKKKPKNSKKSKDGSPKKDSSSSSSGMNLSTGEKAGFGIGVGIILLLVVYLLLKKFGKI